MLIKSNSGIAFVLYSQTEFQFINELCGKYSTHFITVQKALVFYFRFRNSCPFFVMKRRLKNSSVYWKHIYTSINKNS